ncbi:hypothetical protein FY534_05635 [Alicyclobacillus sp. TC]|uniref:hypothetical protein n=1 Tax=Alicyclobacillus sp. TC TaxID=2606450 RepID=UPI001933DAFF|nr:hypothetical protein [Alicyclobacillus sp. TC]QRF23210.1 hypothetical protein FY534_05635 [Alicyclobacillus sp. TC]
MEKPSYQKSNYAYGTLVRVGGEEWVVAQQNGLPIEENEIESDKKDKKIDQVNANQPPVLKPIHIFRAANPVEYMHHKSFHQTFHSHKNSKFGDWLKQLLNRQIHFFLSSKEKFQLGMITGLIFGCMILIWSHIIQYHSINRVETEPAASQEVPVLQTGHHSLLQFPGFTVWAMEYTGQHQKQVKGIGLSTEIHFTDGSRQYHILDMALEPTALLSEEQKLEKSDIPVKIELLTVPIRTIPILPQSSLSLNKQAEKDINMENSLILSLLAHVEDGENMNIVDTTYNHWLTERLNNYQIQTTGLPIQIIKVNQYLELAYRASLENERIAAQKDLMKAFQIWIPINSYK